MLLNEEIDALRATELVEYERVADIKLRALRQAFERFQKSGHTGAFEEFARIEGALLHDFAVFCALDEDIHRRNPEIWLWKDWPAEYQDPRSPAVAKFAEQHRDEVLFYKFLQWQVDRQLAEVQDHAIAQGMKIGLYHDLALATDRFWRGSVDESAVLTRAGLAWGLLRMSWLPAGRIGDSRRPIAKRIARTGTSCSRSPSARTRVTAAHCASIT